jgi:hypothetical protein
MKALPQVGVSSQDRLHRFTRNQHHAAGAGGDQGEVGLAPKDRRQAGPLLGIDTPEAGGFAARRIPDAAQTALKQQGSSWPLLACTLEGFTHVQTHDLR